MADHNTLIGSTTGEIEGGTVLIGGVLREIESGTVLVNGVAREIEFATKKCVVTITGSGYSYTSILYASVTINGTQYARGTVAVEVELGTIMSCSGDYIYVNGAQVGRRSYSYTIKSDISVELYFNNNTGYSYIYIVEK